MCQEKIYNLKWRCECTIREIKEYTIWSILGIKWWLILLSAYWNEPMERPGKVNGTYWMHVKADIYHIKAELKESKQVHNLN